MNDLMTIDELAEKLRVPKSWVYGQTRLKGPESIPCVRVGKYLRFREREVLAWLESREGDRGAA